MDAELLPPASLGMLAICLVVLLVLASELGFRFGFRLQPSATDSLRSHVNLMESAVLGLLALLLSFTAVMTVSRYDLRRQLVLDEANAIDTAHLRTRFLPEPGGDRIRALLRRYVDVRLAFYGAGADPLRIAAALAESARLQGEIWSQAVTAAKADPHSIMTGLLIQSLNDVIDLNAKRLVALENHVPDTIVVALFLVAAVAMGWVGCGIGLCRRRSHVTTVSLVLLITFIVTIIIDLDRPRQGLVRVSQEAMLDLQRSLRVEPPR